MNSRALLTTRYFYACIADQGLLASNKEVSPVAAIPTRSTEPQTSRSSSDNAQFRVFVRLCCRFFPVLFSPLHQPRCRSRIQTRPALPSLPGVHIRFWFCHRYFPVRIQRHHTSINHICAGPCARTSTGCQRARCLSLAAQTSCLRRPPKTTPHFRRCACISSCILHHNSHIATIRSHIATIGCLPEEYP
jgi:hypothetical protein